MIFLRPYKYLRNEEKQNNCETRKDICILRKGSKKYYQQIGKKDTGEGLQMSLLK